MDSGALLDILGNENRRRILRLLAQKPCYVTEISEYLEVSPKAVIDHLRTLEEAGLVKSRTDDRRRKYFYIANDVRLEVNVSRYGFGAKSAYPASASLDLTSCRYLSVDYSTPRADGDTDDLAELASDLRRLETLENELSLAQRYVQGRVAEITRRIAASVGTDAEDLLNGRMLLEILVALARGHTTMEAIHEQIDVPEPVLRRCLDRLEEAGVLEQRGGEWRLPG